MTDNRTTELLPCPFCGGEASKRLFYREKYRVHCNGCDAHSGDTYDTEAEAITAWNTRAELGSESIDYMLNTIGKLEEENERLRSSCGTLTAEQVSLYLKALALDLQSPDPFKSLEEKQAIIEKYAHEIAELGSELQYDELLRCLENDWHISASWDGLRKFWCIELTEEGVKLRDATHGTLTAGQVHDAVLENFEETHETRYDHWEPSKFDWQAIADELNAELGSGTCEFVVKDNMNESEGMGDVWIECSACHCQFDYYADDWLMKMSYCPNCRARIRKAVE